MDAYVPLQLVSCYNNQDVTDQGLRGEDDFDIPSWFMFLGQTHLGDNNLFIPLRLDQI